jgi:hypothetical protein
MNKEREVLVEVVSISDVTGTKYIYHINDTGGNPIMDLTMVIGHGNLKQSGFKGKLILHNREPKPLKDEEGEFTPEQYKLMEEYYLSKRPEDVSKEANEFMRVLKLDTRGFKI